MNEPVHIEVCAAEATPDPEGDGVHLLVKAHHGRGFDFHFTRDESRALMVELATSISAAAMIRTHAATHTNQPTPGAATAKP